jgi:hypothetical protein
MGGLRCAYGSNWCSCYKNWRVHNPVCLCCSAVIQEAAAWSVCMVWQALLNWYCPTGGGRGLWLVAAVGLACLGFVRNRFPFLVEGLYASLLVGDEEGGIVDGFQQAHCLVH